MKNYIFIFHGTTASSAANDQAWNEWFKNLGSTIVDMGHRTLLTDVKTVEQGKAKDFTGEPVAGFMVITAKSLAAAIEIAHNVPSGAVDVYEEYSM